MDEILSTVTIIDGVAGLVGVDCLVISDIYNNFFY
jgi:predicted ATP-grasp superfamily ATP-dependent carboligase